MNEFIWEDRQVLSLHGRRTETVLKKLLVFVELEEGSPEYRFVEKKVFELAHHIGANPRMSDVKYSAPRTWSAP
jgi:hypothetical protein